ncbi:MAG TPA: MEDS domain-containing protein [Burkholderiales bacterium]|jgi:hypothetical protein|nr:MEDS domain-containing protein [Burkholderiales bacterium]
MIEHFVQFYENDAYLANQVAGFIRAGLQAGDAAIVIATKSRRDDLQKRLSADVSRAPEQRPRVEPYVPLDAAETLATFMVDGLPDERRFADVMGRVLKRAAASGNGRLRVYGEMVGLLSTNGKHGAAIRLEELWNELAKVHPFSLFCAYPMRAFAGEADGDAFLRICNVHSRVCPAESYTPPANAHEHYRTIALLQQKAIALETEVARRKELEKTLQRTRGGVT